MRRLLPALVAIVLVAPPAVANAPLVQMIRGDTYTLTPKSRMASLWVPLEMDAGIDLTSVEKKPEVIDFSRAGVSAPTTREALKKVEFKTPENKAPGLEIVVNLEPLIPASYRLRVKLTFTAAGKPEAKSESVDLVLVYQAAKLLQPSPLFVRQTEALPFLPILAPGKTAANGLELELATRDTELHNWRIDAVAVKGPEGSPLLAVADPDGDPLGPRITVTPEALLDRERVTLSTAVAGEFPLGKSTGKIRIKSEELETPVEVAFEVMRQRSKGLIWFFLGIGLIAGFLIRVARVNNELLTERDDTVKKLDELGAASEDATFRGLVTQATTELRQARLTWRSREAARTVMTQAIADALAALQAAQEDFVSRRGEEQGKLTTFAKLVGTDYEPIPSVAEDLRAARESCSQARDLFEKGNVVGAEELRTEAERELGEHSRKHHNEFVDEAKTPSGRKGKVDGAKGVLAYVIGREPVKGARTAWGTALARVTPGTESKGVLEAAHKLWRAESDFAHNLHYHLDHFLGLACEAVGENHGKRLSELRRKVEADTKGKLPPGVTSALLGLKDLTNTVDEAFGAAVDPAYADDLKNALKQGKYGEAIVVAKRPPPTPQMAANLTQELSNLETLFFELADSEPYEPATGPPDPAILEAVAVPDPSASDAGIRRAATQLLGWLGWLLSIVVLAVTGYVTFEKGYVGVWPDFVPIFLWAFGLDIGVNTMLAKGLTKS